MKNGIQDKVDKEQESSRNGQTGAPSRTTRESDWDREWRN